MSTECTYRSPAMDACFVHCKKVDPTLSCNTEEEWQLVRAQTTNRGEDPPVVISKRPDTLTTLGTSSYLAAYVTTESAPLL